MDYIDENDPLPWLLVGVEPEKEADIRLFRRQRFERIQADPEGEERWYVECDEYDPVRALRAKRDQLEVERQNHLDDIAERRRLFAAEHGPHSFVDFARDRALAYLNDLHDLTAQLRDLQCLREAKAEVVRARAEAADPAVSNPAEAKRWLGLCERYRIVVDQCWRAECERRDREASSQNTPAP